METKEDEWSPDETYAAERAVLIAQITQGLTDVAGKLVTVKGNLEVLAENAGEMSELASAWKINVAITRPGN